MPTLEMWNPRPAINSFMTAKKRKDHSNVIERKAKSAPYFDGVFEAANDESTIVTEPNKVSKKF